MSEVRSMEGDDDDDDDHDDDDDDDGTLRNAVRCWFLPSVSDARPSVS